MKATIESKFNTGDTVNERQKVIKVDLTDSGVGYCFRYLLENFDGERRWRLENDIKG